ncbi:MAG: addiction module protein [Chlorobaculum sp.]|nr:addiction module protein [Chlorobaculum sp.]
MSVEELTKEALRLDPKARAQLARELLASLDAMSEEDTVKLWVGEAIRRDEELDSGTTRAYAADEVLERARNRGR